MVASSSITRRVRWPATVLPLALAACATSPFAGVEGVPTSVELLGGGFVRFEGQRVPTETFLLEIRERVRSAQGEPSKLPAVHVRAVGADLGPIDPLLRDLRMAGVRHVVLG